MQYRSEDPRVTTRAEPSARATMMTRLRFFGAWTVGIALLAIGLPRMINVSWHGVTPVLHSLRLTDGLVLLGVWLVGLFVQSFVLTAAAPGLTHRRALTLNVTGSAVSNVVPLGGAAGVELNRRMMRAWGIDTRSFSGFTFLTNLWDVGAKLLLPVVAVLALARAGESIGSTLWMTAFIAALSFAALALIAGTLLISPRVTQILGHATERAIARVRAAIGRPGEVDVCHLLLDIRRDCVELLARGWLQMSLGILGYVALQGVLLGMCLHLTGGGNTWQEVLAGFAVERFLTVVPVTPGGVGISDLGLVGVLIALGGDPAGVAAGAVLYRLFIFVAEIPIGGGTLGLWLLGQRASLQRAALRRQATGNSSGELVRIAHVTDVFLPRLGGIETHVDDLVRHQRDRGLDAHVLTPGTPRADDPAWVHRMPTGAARRTIAEYDAVHVHVSMLSPYGIAVAWSAMRAGVPTLITVHSMWTGAGGILRLAAFTTLRSWPVAWSAVSTAAADLFRRSLGAPVSVLPNAVDVADWRAHDVTDADRRVATEDDVITLISVGRLMPRKRPLQLLRTFQRVRRLAPEADIRLVLVGDGPLRGRVDRFIRRHHLEDRVRVTGRLPRQSVLAELERASVYVAPAPKESFGVAALEARCAGLPIVASRRSGVREYVRDRIDGILVDDDIAMAVAIADLARDRGLRERIASHNRRVAPAFDWNDVLGLTDELYRAAADRAGQSAPVGDDVVVPAAMRA